MTLSESMAMDQFEFLGSEDNLLAARLSRTSIDINAAECTYVGGSALPVVGRGGRSLVGTECEN